MEMNTKQNSQHILDIGEMDGIKEKMIRMCRQNPLALASAVVIVLIIILAILTPVIAPYKEAEQDLQMRLSGPSPAHIFGTDELGRDLFTRILYGSRASLVIGIFPPILSLMIGIVFGLVSGYAGGWIDYLIMRIVTLFFKYYHFHGDDPPLGL